MVRSQPITFCLEDVEGIDNGSSQIEECRFTGDHNVPMAAVVCLDTVEFATLELSPCLVVTHAVQLSIDTKGKNLVLLRERKL